MTGFVEKDTLVDTAGIDATRYDESARRRDWTLGHLDELWFDAEVEAVFNLLIIIILLYIYLPIY